MAGGSSALSCLAHALHTRRRQVRTVGPWPRQRASHLPLAFQEPQAGCVAPEHVTQSCLGPGREREQSSVGREGSWESGLVVLVAESLPCSVPQFLCLG